MVIANVTIQVMTCHIVDYVWETYNLLYGMVIFMYSNIFRDSVNLCVLARIADGFVMASYRTPLHMALVYVDQMIMDEAMTDV